MTSCMLNVEAQHWWSFFKCFSETNTQRQQGYVDVRCMYARTPAEHLYFIKGRRFGASKFQAGCFSTTTAAGKICFIASVFISVVFHIVGSTIRQLLQVNM